MIQIRLRARPDLTIGARARRALTAILLAAPLAALVACGESGEEVVLYYSADEYVARPVIERFEERTGIDVRAVGDTEATKTTGLVQRLRSERDRPRADVFWSSEVFLTVQLAQEGILASHESEAVADWPARLVGEERRWHGFAQRARVIVHNTDRVAEGERPTELMELLEPRWRGRVVMARPEFGTTRGHVGAILALWGEERTRAFFEGLRENDVRLLDGNAAVVRAVATGEADVGLTDTDDVWSGQRNGWPVGLTYVRHDPTPETPGDDAHGVMLIPNTAARVAGGPNEENAGTLIDFLLSAEVERILAESDSHNIPVRDSLAAEYPEYAAPDPIEDLGYREVSEQMAPALRIIDEALGR